MNYIGSKYSLLSFLDESINRVVKEKCVTFCDLFAGTGVVGTYFKRKGYKIISNDLQYYSFVLNKHYIGNHLTMEFNGLINDIEILTTLSVDDRAQAVCQYLDKINGTKGFIYENYCFGGTCDKEFTRQYFTDDNGMKCDAIRQQIETWRNENKINENEYFFLLTTLIENIDKLANTASVYGAFLKKIKKSAQKNLQMIPAKLIKNDITHEVYNEDVNALIKHIKGDILYLDPPYNHRQYAPNYHILETIARYDNPIIKGKTGLRDYSKQKSDYCVKSKVRKVFENLILNANVKYIFLSYNNEGLMSLLDIKEIMSKRGEYGYFTKEYARFKQDKDRTYKANKTTEYIHYVICKQ